MYRSKDFPVSKPEHQVIRTQTAQDGCDDSLRGQGVERKDRRDTRVPLLSRKLEKPRIFCVKIGCAQIIEKQEASLLVLFDFSGLAIEDPLC